MNRETLVADTEELTFSRTFLGYDPLEVRAFVREANRRIARLSSERPGISDDSGGVPEPELSGAIASAVREIDEVLESARLAAQRIRDTAEGDVSDSVETAHQQALHIVAEAEDEAFTLRQVAWEAATEMLEAASSEVTDLRAEAERDALQIIDDAERRAIRELAAARRDSENVLQTARVEYDRLVELASTASSYVDADGGVGVEAQAGEDSKPATAATKRLVVEVPAENEHVEESAPPWASGTYGAIRVIPAGSRPPEVPTKAELAENSGSDEDRGAQGSEPANRLGWADGTRSVRLVDTPAARARVEVDAVEMAREVARLRAESDIGSKSENGKPGAENRADRPDEPSEPARAGNRRGPGAPLVTARRTRSDPAGRAPSDDELAALFSRLRRQVQRSDARA
ncbi:MAG: hypothetical protein J4G11_08405 [Acidimicrobiia bacterium]|nr:hypothetical protein [Acidimicrobiia bacterium]